LVTVDALPVACRVPAWAVVVDPAAFVGTWVAACAALLSLDPHEPHTMVALRAIDTQMTRDARRASPPRSPWFVVLAGDPTRIYFDLSLRIVVGSFRGLSTRRAKGDGGLTGGVSNWGAWTQVGGSMRLFGNLLQEPWVVSPSG
jgi:hypothetical protein